MCNPEDSLLQKEKPADPILIESHAEEQLLIRDELTRLQSWDTAEGQTLEERRAAQSEALIQRQREDNEVLLARAQAQMPPVHAEAAAPGQPVQVQAPAKQTYKERREEKRRDKEAKKHTPYGDHVSYAAVQDLQRLNEEELNSLTPEKVALAEQADVDVRILKGFCQGYRKDKKGNPASGDDRRRQAEDAAWIDAYTSKDLERRKPYLERFTKEIMDIQFSPDMFSDANLERNSAELKRLGDKIVYFENMQKDPINAPFFAGLPAMELELLNAKLNAMTAPFSSTLVNALAAKGVNCDHAGYYGSKAVVDNAIQMRPAYSGILDGGLDTLAQKEKEITDRHLQAAIEAEQAELLRGAQDMKEQAEDMKGLEGLNLTSFVTGYSFDELSKYRAMIEANPAVYAAHKEALDQLYQELYRSIDAMGDLNAEAMACQSVCDTHRMSRARTDRLLTQGASARQDALMERLDLMRGQISATADALQFYLREKPLSDSAKLLLERQGHGAAAAKLVAERSVKKAFDGPEGVVSQSNAAYADSLAKGESAESARSAALQALGIRSSSSAAAQADKLLRGSTYVGLPDDIAVYFHALEDEQKLDMNVVDSQMKKTSVGLGAYVTGGGVDAVNAGMLDLYRRYAVTPESISYLKKMTATLKNADVFGGDSAAALEYLSQCLLNSYGANFIEVDKQRDSYAGAQKTRHVALESCRTLLTLPALMRMEKKDQDALPQSTQELLAQYRQLLHELAEKVNAPE